jgi:hypothetical protein
MFVFLRDSKKKDGESSGAIFKGEEEYKRLKEGS